MSSKPKPCDVYTEFYSFQNRSTRFYLLGMQFRNSSFPSSHFLDGIFSLLCFHIFCCLSVILFCGLLTVSLQSYVCILFLFAKDMENVHEDFGSWTWAALFAMVYPHGRVLLLVVFWTIQLCMMKDWTKGWTLALAGDRFSEIAPLVLTLQCDLYNITWALYSYALLMTMKNMSWFCKN